MSEPNDTQSTELAGVEPVRPEAPPPEASPPEAPHYPPPPPIPADWSPPAAASFRARPVHPMVGASLWVLGALTWVYVVIGELVVNLGLPEPLGWLIVLATTGYTWVVASGLGDGRAFRPRQLLSLLLAFGLFFFLLVFTASLLGSHDRSQISAVTILLWFVGGFALLLGRRWTPRGESPRSTGDRVRNAAIWTLSVLGTLVATISAMSRM